MMTVGHRRTGIRKSFTSHLPEVLGFLGERGVWDLAEGAKTLSDRHDAGVWARQTGGRKQGHGKRGIESGDLLLGHLLGDENRKYEDKSLNSI